MNESPWRLSWRADPVLARMADRHYPRVHVGADQFVPPGRCLVLKTFDGSAGWVTSWPMLRRDDLAGVWINTFFRVESGDWTASELIRWAVAHTRWTWPAVPERGMFTFIDPSQIKSTIPGYCYRRAKFRHVFDTKIYRLPVLQLTPARMPEPAPVPYSQMTLDEAALL
jgi:hypothetical protein